ncbi:MAG: hypothetical protein ABI222_05375 [Opitutaceae bacterium]
MQGQHCNESSVITYQIQSSQPLKTQMLRIVLALFFAAVLSQVSLPAADRDYTVNQDVQILLKTPFFCFGPVDMRPGIPEGETALRRIMKQDDAIRYLIPVFEHGTFEGKCYALVGFRLLAPTYFESSCQRLARWHDSKIKTMEGCIVSDRKLAEVIQLVRAGNYDDEVLGKARD